LDSIYRFSKRQRQESNYIKETNHIKKSYNSCKVVSTNCS